MRRRRRVPVRACSFWRAAERERVWRSDAELGAEMVRGSEAVMARAWAAVWEGEWGAQKAGARAWLWEGAWAWS